MDLKATRRIRKIYDRIPTYGINNKKYNINEVSQNKMAWRIFSTSSLNLKTRWKILLLHISLIRDDHGLSKYIKFGFTKSKPSATYAVLFVVIKGKNIINHKISV